MSSNVVQVAPATHIAACPILGLAVLTDNGMKAQAHRVMLLAQGARMSKLSVIAKAPGSARDNYLVESTKVACRLSASETFVNLRGHCDIDTMLDYRLDTEVAMVAVSAVCDGPDGKALTLESTQKVNQSEAKALQASLAIEWKAALIQADADQEDAHFESPQTQAYWASPSRVVNRITSEPSSPASKALKSS